LHFVFPSFFLHGNREQERTTAEDANLVRKEALKADKRQEDQKTSSTRRLRLPSNCLVIAAQAVAGIMEGRSR
jgi:hypothetical protein